MTCASLALTRYLDVRFRYTAEVAKRPPRGSLVFIGDPVVRHCLRASASSGIAQGLERARFYHGRAAGLGEEII